MQRITHVQLAMRLFTFLLPVIFIFASSSSARTSAFVESLGAQVIAKDGYWRGPTEKQHHGPEFGNNRTFLSYMTNDSSGGPRPHDIIVMMYDYATGSWTRSKIATVPVTGNDGHNAPSLYLTPDGYVEAYYGSIACGVQGYSWSTPGGGPCYKRSTKPFDISAWGPELRVPCPGGINQTLGGFTSDGSLHLFGDLVYYRRAPNGTWAGYNMIRSPTGNAVGTPGGLQDAKIAGDTIHYAWSPYNASGAGRGVYHVMSVDKGITWRNAAGTASFASSAGLSFSSTIFDANWHSTYPYPVYPAAYQIRTGSVEANIEIAVLKNGRTAILESGQGFILWTWSGTQWQPKTIDTQSPLDMNMEVLSNGDVVIHAIMYSQVLNEYVSTDNGATWKKTQIYAKGAEEISNMMEGGVARPAGQKERIILQWGQYYNRSSGTPANHVEIAVLDRPIGQVGTTKIGPQSPMVANPAGFGLTQKTDSKGITFNASTIQQGKWSIALYDLSGKKVWSAEREGGVGKAMEAKWEPAVPQSGVYVAVLKQNRDTSVQRISFVR